MKKKVTIILLFLSAIALGVLGYLIYQKIIIGQAVNQECGKAVGENWVDCAVNIALQKNNAKYCLAGGVFSPFTGMCMSEFANKASDQKYCQTIIKPKYRDECLLRFN